MDESFWRKRQDFPLSRPAFMSMYPFDELAEGGWALTSVSSPRERPGKAGRVQVANLEDRAGRLITIDVDESGRMRDHATFAHSDHSPPLYAMSARAAATLGGSSPDADYLVLAAIKDVLTLEQMSKQSSR